MAYIIWTKIKVTTVIHQGIPISINDCQGGYFNEQCRKKAQEFKDTTFVWRWIFKYADVIIRSNFRHDMTFISGIRSLTILCFNVYYFSIYIYMYVHFYEKMWWLTYFIFYLQTMMATFLYQCYFITDKIRDNEEIRDVKWWPHVYESIYGL